MTRPVSMALLVLRLVAGAAFVIHGWSKIRHPLDWMGAGSSVPATLQALAAVAEFGGGIAWMLGVAVPIASFGILCTMAVAVVRHALIRRDPFVDANGPSYELAAVYLCVALLLLLAGPGRYSANRLSAIRRASGERHAQRPPDPTAPVTATAGAPGPAAGEKFHSSIRDAGTGR